MVVVRKRVMGRGKRGKGTTFEGSLQLMFPNEAFPDKERERRAHLTVHRHVSGK